MNHSRQGFMAINNPCPLVAPSGSGGLWTIMQECTGILDNLILIMQEYETGLTS